MHTDIKMKEKKNKLWYMEETKSSSNIYLFIALEVIIKNNKTQEDNYCYF